MKIRIVKAKVRNPVPVKLVFKSREESDGLIFLKSRNIVKGYMQVPGVDSIESISPVTSDTSTRILIGITIYHEEKRWVAGIRDTESAFLHPYLEVEMYIERP